MGLDALSGQLAVGIDPVLSMNGAVDALTTLFDHETANPTTSPPVSSSQSPSSTPPPLTNDELSEVSALLVLLSLTQHIDLRLAATSPAGSPSGDLPSSAATATFDRVVAVLRQRSRSPTPLPIPNSSPATNPNSNVCHETPIWKLPAMMAAKQIVSAAVSSSLHEILSLSSQWEVSSLLAPTHPTQPPSTTTSVPFIPPSIASLVSYILPFALLRCATSLSATSMPKSTASVKDVAQRLGISSNRVTHFATTEILKWPIEEHPTNTGSNPNHDNTDYKNHPDNLKTTDGKNMNVPMSWTESIEKKTEQLLQHPKQRQQQDLRKSETTSQDVGEVKDLSSNSEEGREYNDEESKIGSIILKLRVSPTPTPSPLASASTTKAGISHSNPEQRHGQGEGQEQKQGLPLEILSLLRLQRMLSVDRWVQRLTTLRSISTNESTSNGASDHVGGGPNTSPKDTIGRHPLVGDLVRLLLLRPG